MARSPLTLAASVTSALPTAKVVGVGALTERSTGRFDSAVVHLDSGDRVVVRVATDDDAAQEATDGARALRVLTPGVRGLLPFRAPVVLGETTLDSRPVVVVDYLSGYRVDAAHLPEGPGAASSLGAALAAVHALPSSIIREEGLPVRTAAHVRDDVVRLIDRAASTGSVPESLIARWRRAVDTRELWTFESAVVLGGADAASFLFADVDGVPQVTGLLDWHGLSVGDPAKDLQWLASAPTAADDVYSAYLGRSERSPDAHVRDRARLYAELEFAKWLIHGHESSREDIVDDAIALLTSLASSVGHEDVITSSGLGVDDAIALLDRIPSSDRSSVDTSMQTDAYDPEELSQWLDGIDSAQADDGDGERDDERDDDSRESAPRAPATEPSWSDDDLSTSPIDLSPPGLPATDDEDPVVDAERASDAALRRWLRG